MGGDLNENSESERGLSNFAKMLIVLALVVATIFAFRLNRAIERANAAAKVAVTKALLANCHFACLSFYTNANRWPVALLELTGNPNGRVYIVTDTGSLLDGWGRPLIYVAPAGTNVGSITSLGEDGLPGGTNLDGDISLTIP